MLSKNNTLFPILTRAQWEMEADEDWLVSWYECLEWLVVLLGHSFSQSGIHDRSLFSLSILVQVFVDFECIAKLLLVLNETTETFWIVKMAPSVSLIVDVKYLVRVLVLSP